MKLKQVMKDRKYKRRRIWTPKDEDFLIALWKDKIGELNGPRRNIDVFTDMSLAFADKNVDYSPAEIKVKVSNLSTKYKKEKKANGQFKGTTSKWPHYNKIHAIMAKIKLDNLQNSTEDSVSEQSEKSFSGSKLVRPEAILSESDSSIIPTDVDLQERQNDGGPSTSTPFVSSAQSRPGKRRKQKDSRFLRSAKKPHIPEQPAPEKRPRYDNDYEIRCMCTNKCSNEQDDYDIFGSFVGAELRTLANNAKTVGSVKKKILQALLEVYETQPSTTVVENSVAKADDDGQASYSGSIKIEAVYSGIESDSKEQSSSVLSNPDIQHLSSHETPQLN